MSTVTDKPVRKTRHVRKPSLRSERLRSGDLIIRRLAVNQPHCRLGVRPGWFRDTLSGQEYERLLASFLAWRRGRVLFQDSQDLMPTCKSSDGLKPSPLVKDPKSGVCGHWNHDGWFVPECPLAAWRFHDGRQCAPVCQETWGLLGVLEEDGQPFWISLKGGSLRPARRFLSMCHEVMRSGKHDLLDCAITLSTSLVEGRSFQYYTVQFSDPLWIAKADPRRRRLGRMLGRLGRAEIQDTYDAEQADSQAPAIAG